MTLIHSSGEKMEDDKEWDLEPDFDSLMKSEKNMSGFLSPDLRNYLMKLNIVYRV